MTSGYGVTAQYYDPLAETAHAEIDTRIGAALAGLAFKNGPVLDIGAGTGLTTRLIAATLPGAEIWAVEPDAAMRPALTTRVWSDATLRDRVTILPMGVLEAPLPKTISGAVLSASLVHFSPADRVRLWAELGERLAPKGRVIVEVQCPEAIDIPSTLMARARIGRIEYEGWAAAKRLDHDRQLWRMTYRACLEGQEITRDIGEYVCWTISADQVVREADAAGLGARIDGPLVIMEA